MSLPTFVTDEPFVAPSTVTLGEEESHHMRVRRLEPGVRVRLLDGQGTRGEGMLTQLAKRHATVAVETADRVEPPPAVHLLVPVADKDRMLWLAEKATELGVTSWRPVMYRRSKHVTPRGEGPTFQQKTRARMAAALGQSGGAWLPTLFPEATVEHAVAALPPGVAVMLDAGAPPLLDVLHAAFVATPPTSFPPAVTIAVGPEGGFEDSERDPLLAGGFLKGGIGASILRFETAAVAGVSVARAAIERRS